MDLLEQEPIIWDSAPAAMAHVMPILECRDPEGRKDLRLILLSGDWIPVSLPDEIRGEFPGARVVALGGATECTVWSNSFPIGDVDPAWPSIPYGRPMQNARYYVLDAGLEPCPVGVPGDLHIAGDCVALGYAGAPRLTAARFLPERFAPEGAHGRELAAFYIPAETADDDASAAAPDEVLAAWPGCSPRTWCPLASLRSRPFPSVPPGRSPETGCSRCTRRRPGRTTATRGRRRVDMTAWLRCFDRRPTAAVRVVCFPHAGGSAPYFRDWHTDLPPEVEVHAVQYPGRGDRLRDPLVDDARRMADLAMEALAPLLDRPVALFGHSLGAILAYEVAPHPDPRRGAAEPSLRLWLHGPAPRTAVHRALLRGVGRPAGRAARTARRHRGGASGASRDGGALPPVHPQRPADVREIRARGSPGSRCADDRDERGRGRRGLAVGPRTVAGADAGRQ
ncbi:AMP-binding protein [Streptomyces sp. ISL-86]|nr:AMP-binding protein [Streptomyces sp. ISL-86]